ncbi:LodA/GoxA family CTQ-dependent oxidase [Kitasatospora sp. NPDC048296]|uniref:LodA/GoxA family CTQ-dependent oxidase n=1 Tax=Kitasatospora sp. NPDC048296 TaxID=3364048 RepID=UPI0037182B0F
MTEPRPITSIQPTNLSAQLHYRAPGNPPSTLPAAAISNAFPGLEFDFRNIWRRIFEGIELHEADNLVVRADPDHQVLEGCRLLRVAGEPVVGSLVGPQLPRGASGPLTSAANPDGVTMLEWSNSLAKVLDDHAGRPVTCEFTMQPSDNPVGIPDDPTKLRSVDLVVRPLFAVSEAAQDRLAVIDEQLVQPGDLTRSLCSPWQNDYRECACYYWAASRPDYVNVDVDEQGVSVGNHWLSVHREPREYVLDNGRDTRLLTYDDLFREWQQHLRFIVGGRDYPDHR